MKEFLDKAEELWRVNAIPKPADERFETVFKARAALQAVHSKAELDLDNIESVFTTCEMARTLGRFPGKTEAEIDDLIRALKVVIVQTLERTVLFPVERGAIVSPPPYGAFAELVRHLREEARPRHKVSIITFNYDIAADYSLYQNGLAVDYALENNPAPDVDAVPLLKLHGSLNWSETIPSVPEKAVIAWTMGDYWRTRRIHIVPETKFFTVPIGSQLAEMTKHGKTVTGEAVLVPPTWNKAETHRALSHVWQRAAGVLSEAENIFVMGYSMPETDAFFRYLYALGTVGQTLLKRFWVFDPDKSGAVKQRFAALLGPGAKARFDYISESFAEAIDSLKKTFPPRENRLPS
jgi:hypothetical protein